MEFFSPGLALFGLFLGLAIGLSGVGAGVLLTPFLIRFVGMDALTAVGTALVFGTITKVGGAAQHVRQGTVDLRVVRWMATGSLPLGIAGSLVVTRFVPNGSRVTAIAVTAAVLVSALVMTWRFVVKMRAPNRPASAPALTGLGSLVGLMSGLTSIGSGSVAIGGLAVISPLTVSSMVGTDLVHALILSAATAPIYLTTGHVDLPVVAGLLVGSVPGVLIGSRLAGLLPERWMKAAVLVTVWSIVLRLL